MYTMKKAGHTATVDKSQIDAMKAQGWKMEDEVEAIVNQKPDLTDTIKQIGEMTRNAFDAYVAEEVKNGLKVEFPDNVKKLDDQKAFVIELLTNAAAKAE